ncbi:tRNA lysidine(34) synthetase [Vibrio spartinae]|uniref:tRNA(Ile)-lysidine synthase TilS/MesJ n=1 Tax=Vibrio spartinae TaxID=1918945 RepID=A0ABX6R4R0_9VIBR|nr:hypothetical protein [Vibrio spartinae]QMV16152.1 hypothetical protein Vspart_03537 [Vibrio spartinae]
MNITSITQLPNVTLITTHGRMSIKPLNANETLFELIDRAGIPWSAISAFSSQPDGDLVLLPSLDTPFSCMQNSSEILLHFNRNVNPDLFNIQKYNIAKAENGPEVSSYLYQQIDNNAGTVSHILKDLSQLECQDLVRQHVHNFITENFSPGTSFVVGISGGGDSNAMLMAMTSFDKFDIYIQPVILKGVADWDAGVPRAQELCRTYGLDLRVIDESQVREICGMRNDQDLIQAYEANFPGDDFEFLGTFLIRRVLSHIAAETGSIVCTGLNFEDILAECLYRVCSGKPPLSFPVRQLMSTRFAYPLWMTPKKIIDGCFPKLSVDNYDMRYPCFSVGRNLYYMMAYTLQSKFPGSAERLVKGMSELVDKQGDDILENDIFGSILNGEISLEASDRFKHLMGEK